MNAAILAIQAGKRDLPVGWDRREYWSNRSLRKRVGGGVCGVERNSVRTSGRGEGVRGRVDVLFDQHRQVLCHGMSEVRSEHADVVAASITHSQNRLRSELVSDSKTGSESVERILHVSIQSVAAVSGHTNDAGASVVHDVGESSVAFSEHGFRRVNLPPQAVVESQL